MLTYNVDNRSNCEKELPPHRPGIPFQICSFAMRYDDLIAWADKQQLGLDRLQIYRQEDALRSIFPKLPKNRPRKFALVSHKEKSEPAHCIIVRDNRSPDGLRAAQDLERITVFQKALGTSESPQWYRSGELYGKCERNLADCLNGCKSLSHGTAEKPRLTAHICHYYAALLRTHQGFVTPTHGKLLNYVQRIPLGVVAQITVKPSFFFFLRHCSGSDNSCSIIPY